MQAADSVHEGIQVVWAFPDADSSPGGGGGSSGGGGGGASGRWHSGLDGLSGGQRTLVSLAFVVSVRWLHLLAATQYTATQSRGRFSIHINWASPPPLCCACPMQVTVSGAATSLLLMDEVDAALDETNQQHVR